MQEEEFADEDAYAGDFKTEVGSLPVTSAGGGTPAVISNKKKSNRTKKGPEKKKVGAAASRLALPALLCPQSSSIWQGFGQSGSPTRVKHCHLSARVSKPQPCSQLH